MIDAEPRGVVFILRCEIVPRIFAHRLPNIPTLRHPHQIDGRACRSWSDVVRPTGRFLCFVSTVTCQNRRARTSSKELVTGEMKGSSFVDIKVVCDLGAARWGAPKFS